MVRASPRRSENLIGPMVWSAGTLCIGDGNEKHPTAPDMEAGG
jgi:hypothetical protein